MKGACLLLLGMATTAGGRSFAADINMLSFATPSDTSRRLRWALPTTESLQGRIGCGPRPRPFRSNRRTVATAPPQSTHASRLLQRRLFCGAPGRFWFSGQYHLLVDYRRSTCLRWSPTLRCPPAPAPHASSAISDVQDGDHDGYRFDRWHVARLQTLLGPGCRLLRRCRQLEQLRQRLCRRLP